MEFVLEMGCLSLRWEDNLVELDEKVMKLRMLNDLVGSFRQLMKNKMSFSSNCIMRGRI